MDKKENLQNLINKEETTKMVKTFKSTKLGNNVDFIEDSDAKTTKIDNEKIYEEIRLKYGRKYPTMKQKIWLEKLIETRNGSEAGRVAYPNQKYPEHQTYNNLKAPHLKECLQKMLESQGLKLKDTIQAHSYCVKQTDDLPTKLKAVQEHYELIGLHPEKNEKPSVSVGLVIQR